MGCENLPIQVLVHYDAAGSVRPLRFQFEDPARECHTFHIEQILDCHQIGTSGSASLLYICKTQSRGAEGLFELKYQVLSHKWIMLRQIY